MHFFQQIQDNCIEIFFYPPNFIAIMDQLFYPKCDFKLDFAIHFEKKVVTTKKSLCFFRRNLKHFKQNHIWKNTFLKYYLGRDQFT